MKNDVGLAKESSEGGLAKDSAFMLIVLILRKFLVVASRLATLLEHWQPSTLGVLILRNLVITNAT